MKPTRRKRRTPTPTAALFAWAMYDWASSSFATVIETFVLAAYFTRHVAVNPAQGSAGWGTAVGLAGLVVAITGPLLGAAADQGGRRKPWIAVFTGLCIVATALLWFVRPSAEFAPLALLLLALGIIGSELAGVFYNAMLPELVPPERIGRWSGWSWGIGYAGGLASLVLALFAFIEEGAWLGLDRSAAEPVRATFILVAVWYLVFSLPLLLVTPDAAGTSKPFAQSIRRGFGQLLDSIREIRRYGPIVRFLIARMIYIDGLVTLFAFGGLYAAGTFDLSEAEVLRFGIALNVTAGLGAAAFAWLDDWFGSRRTILVSLVGLTTTAALTMIAGSVTMFWVAALSLGIFVGPVQAASRAYLARVAPEALRTQMFGLFALSGKATAFVGPLLVGWITFWSGSQRLGMSVILVFFVVGFLLLLSVPEDR